MLHPTQYDIISSLKNVEITRFSDLQPNDVDNDSFNYHLKQLIKHGLVDKTIAGYKLSKEGIRYVADKHHTSDEFTRLFKLNVITIVWNSTQNTVLVQDRTSHPSFGKIGVMGGTVLKGESIIDGAKRKFQEETTLLCDNFRHVGTDRRIQMKDNEIFSDIIFPICVGTLEVNQVSQTVFGNNRWLPIAEVIKFEAADERDNLHGVIRCLEYIQNNQNTSIPSFFDEYSE